MEIISLAKLETLRNAAKFSATLAYMGMSSKILDKPVDEGILPKDVPAVIYIYLAGIPIYQTNKFILTNVIRQRSEKLQVSETFGKPNVVFFGERTKIYTIQGVVLDAKGGKHGDYEYEWAAKLQYFYDNYLRGSVLTKKTKDAISGIAILKTAGLSIEGYPTQLSFHKSAEMQNYQQFNMTWIVDRDITERLLTSNDPLTFESPDMQNSYVTPRQVNAYNKALASGDRKLIAKFFADEVVIATAAAAELKNSMDISAKANTPTMVIEADPGSDWTKSPASSEYKEDSSQIFLDSPVKSTPVQSSLVFK